MIEKPQIASRWLVTPAESAQRFVEWSEQLQQHTGITFGCVLDKVLIPLRAGDLMAIVARPGHCKTSMMAYLCKREAERIRGKQIPDKVALFVSWEQSIEEVELLFLSSPNWGSSDFAWGRVPADAVMREAVRRPMLPVWLVGQSVTHPVGARGRMTVNAVYDEIEQMHKDFGVSPSLICFDYLQAIPVPHAGDRVREVHEAVQSAKNLAIALSVPIVMGVQASRTVDERANPFPTMGDAQWSSGIEQISDKLISLCVPSRIWEPEDKPTINIGGKCFVNRPELLGIAVRKQRFYIGEGRYGVWFEPQTLTLKDYDVYRDDHLEET